MTPDSPHSCYTHTVQDGQRCPPNLGAYLHAELPFLTCEPNLQLSHPPGGRPRSHDRIRITFYCGTTCRHKVDTQTSDASLRLRTRHPPNPREELL